MSGIVIEKVRKSFDTKDGVVEALKDVNLNIDSGDIYGIIGMSGAGKSTLVRCMNFLEVPTEGQVLIDGKALGDLTEKELRKQREEIGMIFQHFNLLMQKLVIDNVCFPLYIKGKKKAEARKRAAELLEIVGLGDRQNAYPAQLSGGQKQRVAIARSLCMKPEVLLDALRRAGATIDEESTVKGNSITKADLYDLGLIGPDSVEKRKTLCKRLELPEHLSANALVEVLNLLMSREELEKLFQ